MYNYEISLEQAGFEKDTEESGIAVDMYLNDRYSEGWFKRLDKRWFSFLTEEGDYYIISREDNTRIKIDYEELLLLASLASQIRVHD